MTMTISFNLLHNNEKENIFFKLSCISVKNNYIIEVYKKSNYYINKKLRYCKFNYVEFEY